MTLQQTVESLFAADGMLQSVTGRTSREQAVYAGRVAAVLSSPKMLGLLEAATGTGKTLGYLLPAMIALATGQARDRIVVVTYTRALQRQIMQSDVQVAHAVLRKMDLPPPKVALRMGKAAFFSPIRVTDRVQWLLANQEASDEVRELWRTFEQFAYDSAENGSGMWMDWLDRYANLPPEISQGDISLSHVTNVDNPAFERHVANAEDAELLITNYASLLITHHGGIFKADTTLHALICDEAHEIPNACKSLTSRRYQLRRIRNDIRRASTFAPRKLVDETFELVERWEKQLADDDKQLNLSFWTDAGQHDLLTREAIQAQMLYNKLRDLSRHFDDSSPNRFDIETVHRLEDASDTLSFFLSGSEGLRQRAIGFSDQFRLPSLASISVRPGLLFGARARQLTSRIILTSATLADASQRTEFRQICVDLGLHHEQPRIEKKIEPQHFGEMRFVLPPRTLDKPIVSVEESNPLFSEGWLTHTGQMIQAAAVRGITLVLALSFNEIKRLVPYMQPADDWLVHEAGQSIMELIQMFSTGQYRVLITPSAWEGVSIRDAQGQQLFTELVITRLPFPPPDLLHQQLAEEYALSQGRDRKAAATALYIEQQTRTVNKMRQGIGRGIRAASDKITLSLCDPRIPHAGEKGGLVQLVPNRFRAQYAMATIFTSKDTPVGTEAALEPILF